MLSEIDFNVFNWGRASTTVLAVMRAKKTRANTTFCCRTVFV